MSDNDTVKIRYWIRTDNVGSQCSNVEEIDREIWEGMTDQQKENWMQEAAFNHMEWGWLELEEGEDHE
jgi:hypothetical protein